MDTKRTATPRRDASEDEVLEMAARILEQRMGGYRGDPLDSPAKAGEIACLRLGSLEHEVFATFWLDATHRLLEYEELFRGTLTQTSVYPREVVKSAIRVNAAAAIFAHNHPSGSLEPSTADELLTRHLKQALALVDVRVVDHLVVSGNRTRSMAEIGMI
ncbi:MAG: JAB domain-containing protein [Patescibacteria group bacterium]